MAGVVGYRKRTMELENSHGGQDFVVLEIFDWKYARMSFGEVEGVQMTPEECDNLRGWLEQIHWRPEALKENT